MECICTGCGRKKDSKELVFDLTERVCSKINEIIEIFVEDNERKAVLKAYQAVSNVWKENCLFLVSEQTLWEMPQIEEENRVVTDRYVRFILRHNKIIQEIDAISNPEISEDKNVLKKWVEDHSLYFNDVFISLWLKKIGDGDIRFNRIMDKDTRETIAKTRRCPDCKTKVSYWAGRYRELCLTVLGGPRVSKSTTLTACASIFLEKNQNIIWEGHPEDEAWLFFHKNYLEPYESGKPLKATNPEDDRIPQVTFRVTVGDGNFLCLTFIDLPGELAKNQIDERVFIKYKPFYDNMDFVWYCTDPGEILQIRGTAQQREVIAELGYSGEQSVLNTKNIIENMETLAAFFQMADRKVPVAYIMGKTDAGIINDDERRNYKLYFSDGKEEFNPLDEKKFLEQSRSVRAYIEKHNPDLIRCFEQCFKARCYIAISAYGYNPKESSAGERSPRPYHCTLPFMWMMALCNCIPIHTRYKNHFLLPLQDVIEMIEDLPEKEKNRVLRNLYTQGAYRI